MNVYYEIIGYIGTALVILSMMMTSATKLRIVNISGSVVSTIYALLVGTYPVALLNLSLIAVNVVQLLRAAGHKHNFTHLLLDAGDKTLLHFLEVYREDIEKFFPNYRLTAYPNTEVHIVYIGAEPVGVLVGTRAADVFSIELDYAIPKYRDLSVGRFLFANLKAEGVEMLTARDGSKSYVNYMKKLGFADENGILTKCL